jgi:hypothetical protein
MGLVVGIAAGVGGVLAAQRAALAGGPDESGWYVLRYEDVGDRRAPDQTPTGQPATLKRFERFATEAAAEASAKNARQNEGWTGKGTKVVVAYFDRSPIG